MLWLSSADKAEKVESRPGQWAGLVGPAEEEHGDKHTQELGTFDPQRSAREEVQSVQLVASFGILGPLT